MSAAARTLFHLLFWPSLRFNRSMKRFANDYDFRGGIFVLLKSGGRALITMPFLYPLHDEPGDYWRFTEHALRRLLDRFEDVTVTANGLRRAPLAYVAMVTKS